ncbi:MAG: ABC transporter ATP-binding protein [Planctomycetota bacterium]
MLIQAASLTKKYGTFTALDDCSFEGQRGEVLGLLGPNGAGKTTLLRLLMGFLKPTSGSATIDGCDCYSQSVEAHRRLTYMPGDARFSRKLSGRKILEFFAELRPTTPQAAIGELVDRLDLDASGRVAQMSTGMRQKLALVATLAPDVPLVVLDEPTSNLDPTARHGVLQLLREAKDAGKTVLFSSHVMSEVEEVCDRVIILQQGRLVETIRMADIRRQHRIQAQLTGPLASPARTLAEQMQVSQDSHGAVTIITDGSLEPLLGWLAEQPLAELQIEPIGLRAAYERHHPTH